jgi:hypothetical protein
MTSTKRMPAVAVALLVAALALAAVSFVAAPKAVHSVGASANSALLSHPYKFSGPGR